MSGFYFYTAVIAFAFGVTVASLVDISFSYVLLGTLLAGAVWLLARRKSNTFASGKLILISLALLAVVLGIIRFEFAAQGEMNPVYETQVGEEIIVEGKVVREPDVREKATHLYVRVADEILLVKTHRYADVAYGDMLVVQGKLEKPESFETDLGRTFNYPGYLHARGVSYAITFAEVAVSESGQGNWFISKILTGKQLFMRNVEKVLPEPQVGLAEGLLLGVKQALGDELETVFRRTGIIHIVVLSGYNVMLVVIFITYVLSYILPYRARFVFGLGAIVSFAILVGLSATVVRASIMAALILFARATGRTYAVMRALLFAGLIMVLINPYLLVYDVGFQLSFVATLGLIFLSPFIEQRIQFMPTVFGMREFLTATVATQIFVMPILLYNIGELSIISVIVNVLVLPMVPVAMFLTFVTGLLGFVFTPLAVVLGFVTHLSLSYILTVATLFAQIPFATFTVPAFPFWVVVVSYGALGYGLYRLYAPKQKVQNNVLTGWTIEEEEDVVKRITASPLSKQTDDNAVTEIPIFFR